MHIDFGSILVTTCLYFSTKNPSKIELKIDSKRQWKFDWFSTPFLIDLGSILRPKLGPCWPLIRHKTPPRPTKKTSKINANAQDSPNSSRIPPDLDFGAPRPRFCPPGLRFWYHQTSIFKWFGLITFLPCYIVTLLLSYIVTLLHCYLIAFLLCSWRGGGVAALLRCWIQFKLSNPTQWQSLDLTPSDLIFIWKNIFLTVILLLCDRPQLNGKVMAILFFTTMPGEEPWAVFLHLVKPLQTGRRHQAVRLFQ